MGTKLYYNNQEILSGQPTPLVRREDSMVLFGERWAEQVSITLNGQITGCPLSFNGLIDDQERLLSIFNKDFQTFTIEENGSGVYSNQFVQVQSVRFPSSKYVGILNYEVSLQCYPFDLFSGTFGVTDPDDSWQFEENEQSIIRVTHTVSARGLNTSLSASNALNNAKNFVQSRTGLLDIIKPNFITVQSGTLPCLKTFKEDINRFNGIYKITSTYEWDTFYNSDGLLRYSTEFNCNPVDGLAKVTIEGSVQGCANASIDDVRYRYSQFDIYGAALQTYESATSRTDLNSGYLRSGVSEEPLFPKISFQNEFDNFTGANVFVDYRSTVTSGDNDIVSVAVEATVGARGDLKTKWERVSGFYSSGLELFNVANNTYNDFVGSYPIPLNPAYLTSGVTYNKFIAEIKSNASFDNRQVIVPGFQTFAYTLDFTPSLEKVIAKPLATYINGAICGNEYKVTDLGYANRCIFSMNGDGKLDCETSIDTAIANLKIFANNTFSANCPTSRAVLEVYNIRTGYQSVGFNFTWSAESSEKVINSPSNYTSINSLALI